MTQTENFNSRVSDEILFVDEYALDAGDALVTCPHCKRALSLDSPVKGAQYQDKICGGWLEISMDAKRQTIEHIVGEEF